MAPGWIVLDGQVISSRPALRPERRGMGMVFQAGAVTLEERATPDDDVLEGKVEGVQYLGETEEVRVRAAGLDLSAKGVPARVAVGDPVRVRLGPTRWMAFPAE